MTALTLYPLDDPSTTLANAHQFGTGTGGTQTASTGSVRPGAANRYMELRGNTYVDTATTSYPANASGYGWLFDVTTLEGKSIPAGDWVFTLSACESADVTTDWTGGPAIQIWKRSSAGVYTLMGQALSSDTGALTVSYVAHSVTCTVADDTVFDTGDKLYIELYWRSTVRPSTSSYLRFYGTAADQTSGIAAFTITTPGYVAAPVAIAGTAAGNATGVAALTVQTAIAASAAGQGSASGALVDAVPLVHITGQQVTSTDTNTVTITATTAHNLLVAMLHSEAGTDSFTMPDGWIQIGTTVVSNGDNSTSLWYYPDNPGGITSVACKRGTSGIQAFYAIIAEYRDIEYTDVLDQNNSGTGAGSTAITPASITTTHATDLLIVVGGADYTNSIDSVTDPWVLEWHPTLSGYAVALADRITLATNTYQPTLTAAANATWGAIQAGFKMGAPPVAIAGTSAGQGGAVGALSTIVPSPTKRETNGATFDITNIGDKPTGAQVGDILIAYLVDEGNHTITPPDASWHQLGNWLVSGSSYRYAFYWHEVVSDDPSSWTWSITSRTYTEVIITAFYNVDTSDPVHVSNHAEGTGTAPNVPYITTTLDDCLISVWVNDWAGKNWSSGGPTGYTLDPGIPTNIAYDTASWHRNANVDAGTYGNETISYTGSGSYHAIIVLALKGGGGAPPPVEIAATATGQGVASAAVTVTRGMVATATGQGVAYADLHIGAVAIAGTAVGVATAPADIDITTAIAGTSAGQGIGAARLSAQINGTAQGQATAGAALTITRGIVATAAGVATGTAALTVTRGVVATAAGVAGAEADISIGGAVSLSGTSAGVGVASARLTVQVVASAAGVATAPAAITVTRGIVGTASGVSAPDGALTVTRGIVGTAQGQATASAQIQTTPAVAIGGTAAGVATALAALIVTRGIVGTSAGVAGASAQLLVTRGMLGTASGQAGAIAALKVTTAILAIAAGVAVVECELYLPGTGIKNPQPIGAYTGSENPLGASGASGGAPIGTALSGNPIGRKR